MKAQRPIAILAAMIFNTTVIADDNNQETIDDSGIAPQALDTALEEFAERSGLQVIYLADVARGKQSPGAQPDLSDQATLDQLLASTDIEYEFLNDNTVTLQAIDERGASDSKNLGSTPVLVAQNRTSQAQTSTETSSSSGETIEEAEEIKLIDEIVVTGSNIRGAVPQSVPVFSFSAVDLEQSGYSTVGEFLEFLPQNFTGIGDDGFDSGVGSEGPAINLRGLGANETLTLINGRRVASASSFGSFVDISAIPATAVERIDVLLDGASAIYGADAVAGVVNIVLKKRFEGVEVNARRGTVTDGSHDEFRASLTAGDTWGGGGGTISYEYFERSDLRSVDRDFVASETAFDLIPNEERHSVSLALTQDLSSNLSVDLDGLYSTEKSNTRRSTIEGLREVDIDTSVYSVGGTTAGEFDFGAIEFGFGLSERTAESAQILETSGGLLNREFATKTSTDYIDIRLSSKMFRLPGGAASYVVGAGVRNDEVEFKTTDLFTNSELFFINEDRDVWFGFAEFLLPLVSDENALIFVKELELNVSARYEEFSDFGGSTNPRIGIAWRPLTELLVRGSYGTSFRAPELRDLKGNETAAVISLPEFGLPDVFPELGPNIALINQGVNADLGPQESESLSIGIIWEPGQSDLTVNLDYFQIEYDDRISTPSVPLGGLFSALAGPPGALPFFSVSPSTAEVSEIIDRVNLAQSFTPNFVIDDPSTFNTVTFIFDNRKQNLSLASVSGLDARITYEVGVFGGTLSLDWNSSYLFENEVVPIAGADPIIALNTFGNPIDFQSRAMVTWSRQSFTGNLVVNFIDGYSDTTSAPEDFEVGSWTTFDAGVSFLFPADISARISILNLLDEDPPFVSLPTVADVILGYDPANASPRGRFVALELSKRW